MIQQVRDDDEDGGLVLLYALVGDGRGQMGFAAAVAACEEQPALRLFGKCQRDFESPDQAFAFMRR